MSPKYYNMGLSSEDQIDMEERIEEILADASDLELFTQDGMKKLSTAILMEVLRKFRPDLMEES